MDYPIGQSWIFDIGVAQIEHRFEAPGRFRYRILTGERAGEQDSIAIDVQPIREALFLVSWKERDGSTVVHLEDFEHNTFHSCFTAPNGELHRFHGKMRPAS